MMLLLIDWLLAAAIAVPFALSVFVVVQENTALRRHSPILSLQQEI
jgi:hypothetical protein